MKTEDMKKEELIEELEKVKNDLEYKKFLIDKNPVGLTISTIEGKVISVNPAILKFFGIDTEEEFLNYPAEDYWVDPNDRKKMIEIIKEKGEIKDYESKLKTKDGTLRWALLSFIAMKDSAGRNSIVGSFEDIDERKKAEKEAMWNIAVLDASNKFLLRSLTCETEKDVAKNYLQAAEELTGSKFGFMGELNEKNTYDTISISNPGWKECKMPESDAIRLLYDMELRGIWAVVLASGESLIANEPSSHPASVGTPKGHPPITSFLGVPFKQNGKTFGMIALGNKEGGYDERDQQAIEKLSDSFIQAYMRRRSVKRELVGDMFRDLQNVGQLSERTMFKVGETLSKRIKSEKLNEFLNAYNAMGFGELRLLEEIKEQGRWVFVGNKLVEFKSGFNKPTCNYTLGFLCGAISSTSAGVDVAGIEIECQSVGDELCSFVIQIKEEK